LPRHRLTSSLRRALLLPLLLALPPLSQAHFQELIPSADIITQENGNQISLSLTFTHPMEGGPIMQMDEPVRFAVIGPAGESDLKESLKAVERDGKRTYRADYRVKEPGDYLFFLEPAAYWEPAEGVMIVHYTKVVVDAFGAEAGWDRDIGLPVEISPLTRPYGLWTGNLFRGVVKRHGQPVPYAKVEVEWRNDGSLKPPADAFITQVVKADANGVFAYAMPRQGWWGFAALLEGEKPMPNPQGESVPVEAGGLIWVHVQDMK
jgi:cobalt/nickel transport protein